MKKKTIVIGQRLKNVDIINMHLLTWQSNVIRHSIEIAYGERYGNEFKPLFSCNYIVAVMVTYKQIFPLFLPSI